MIAQALRNSRASAGKHLSLVIVNADCQPRERAVHRQFIKRKFRVSSFKSGSSIWQLAFSKRHLARGSCQSDTAASRCLLTCAKGKITLYADLKLETRSEEHTSELQSL